MNHVSWSLKGAHFNGFIHSDCSHLENVQSIFNASLETQLSSEYIVVDSKHPDM